MERAARLRLSVFWRKTPGQRLPRPHPKSPLRVLYSTPYKIESKNPDVPVVFNGFFRLLSLRFGALVLPPDSISRR